MIRLVTSTILLVGLASAASAASLSDVNGPVLVDKGNGFVKVSSSTDLKAGARVMIGKNGKASLVYSDGCRLRLSASTVTTVVDSGACAPVGQVAGQEGVAPVPPVPGVLPVVIPTVVIGTTTAAITVAAFLVDDKNNNVANNPPAISR